MPGYCRLNLANKKYEMAAIAADAGMVIIQAHTIRRAIPHRTAEKR